MNKEIQMGSVAKSYMQKGSLTYEEIRKFLTIQYMRRPGLCNRSLLNFLIYEENQISFLSVQSMGPYAGADYNRTSSHTVVDSKVQLSTLTTTKANKCFAIYLKMEQTIRKGRVRGRGREEEGAGFISQNIHFMEHGQPHAWLPLSPLQSWL